MLYQLTEHNAYWAQVMRADLSKGRTAQRVCTDTFRAILMMGRALEEAMRLTQEAACWAEVAPSAVRWGVK